MPKPLLTLDQLNLLKYDNVPSGKFKTNLDFKITADKKFEEQINLYSFTWTSGGQFSKNNNNNKKKKTFRLDQIAPANSINHLAHDAFGDVMATKQLAQLIFKKKPSFYI